QGRRRPNGNPVPEASSEACTARRLPDPRRLKERCGHVDQRGPTMTEPVEAARGSTEILAIEQLVLHRETLANLAAGRPDRELERAPTNGNKCTLNVRCATDICPTNTCVCSIF